MTKDELTVWIKAAECVDRESHYDGRGNTWGMCIYKVAGMLYRVSFCNDSPDEVWGDKGYIRGVYEPERVTAVEYTEIHIDYVAVKRNC